MNIQAYIESGVLELYTSGALTEQEMREVERMAENYPEVKKELDEIENALFQFHENLHTGPRADLKDSLLNAVKLSSMSSTVKPFERIAEKKETTNSIEAIEEEKVISINKPSRSFNYALAASIALLIASNIGLFLVWKNWNTTKQELANVKEEFKQSTLQIASLETSYKVVDQELEMLRSPDFVKLKLNGMPLSPTSTAVIHWNKSDNKVMIDKMQLPLADKQHDYQLWAIVDGKPVDLGTFSVADSSNAMIEMKTVGNAQAFAVTLEPKGGSINPSMDQMYLMGKI